MVPSKGCVERMKAFLQDGTRDDYDDGIGIPMVQLAEKLGVTVRQLQRTLSIVYKKLWMGEKAFAEYWKLVKQDRNEMLRRQ